MARNWFISACDQYGNPVGKALCVTDAVLDTAGEDSFDVDSTEQMCAAEALCESEYGSANGYYKGIYYAE